MPRKKKEPPVPLPCKCGRAPMVAKARGSGWIVACPSITDCDFNKAVGSWPTEEDAVNHWNEKVQEK